MLNSWLKRPLGVNAHRAAGILIALLIVGIAPPSVWAVDVASLYSAQVPLDPEQDDPRARAYEEALIEVLQRVSGSELSADPEMIELLFPDPAAYVVQYRTGADDTLWVSFDGKAIENNLRQAGQTVWGMDRPLTIVWLAVDWGQGNREIIAADDHGVNRDTARSIDRNRLLQQRVLDIAQRLGLPIVFPLLDAEDLQNVSFSDIWGGFDDQLLLASQRYQADSILVGRIRPTSSQSNRWSYYFGGQQRDWTGEPELVVSLVGDLLAAEFAIGGNAPLETIELNIAGINSVHAYGAVQKLLASLDVIETFSITSVEGDRIHYSVALRGGAGRLSRALRLNGLIEQIGIDSTRFPDDFPAHDRLSASLEFFYSP